MQELVALTNQQVQRFAPSVFATEPYHEVSDKYRFISTAHVLDALRQEGVVPVSARQTRSRIADKREYGRHEVRLVREADLGNPARKVGDSFYQVLLTNSHDRASPFKLDAGLFRLVCANGLTVPTDNQGSIRVRHSGNIGNVIDGVFSVLDEQEEVLAMVEGFTGIPLPREAQFAFASAALELRESTIEVAPATILRPRRYLDANDNDRNLPRPDLWTTLNVVQENLQKGGVEGVNANGRIRRTREVKDISADQRMNKALFVLANELKTLL